MRRTLPYRPRFNAPPRSTPPTLAVVPRHRVAVSSGIWWLLGVLLLLAAVTRTVHAQGRPVAEHRDVDPALAAATADSAWSRVAQSYYDTTFRGHDWGTVRRELQARTARARRMSEVRAAIEAMFAVLGESHFALLPVEATGGWDAVAADPQSLGVVGLDLRLLDDDVVVTRVATGSAAERAGLRPGWTLEWLDALEVAPFVHARLAAGADGAAGAQRLARLQLPLALMARLRGDVHSKVALTLRDGSGAQRRVTLVRRPTEGEIVRFGPLPPQVVRFEHERRDDADGCVGVMRFNVWMTPVMPRLDDAMVDFQLCRGVVIDLRGNVGGVAAMVMGMGGYFLDSTVSLGTMTTRRGALRYVSNPRRSDRSGRPLSPFEGRVAILVDRLSVSTSEIFAAALQELGRARVFGEPSAGQALPSMVSHLPNGDIMQYVVADFTSPRGERIEAHGVIPDEQLPLSRGALLEGHDEPLEAAVRWINDAAPVTSSDARSRDTRAIHHRPPHD